MEIKQKNKIIYDKVFDNAELIEQAVKDTELPKGIQVKNESDLASLLKVADQTMIF